MKENYFIEGHKSKTSYEHEETLILDDKKTYTSEEKATAKAKEYFEKDQTLGLIVIYKKIGLSEKASIKFIHLDMDGALEEINAWWKPNKYSS